MFPGTKRAIATITTNDGREFVETVDHAKGSPRNPLSDDELIAKFRANAQGVIDTGRQDAIIQATWEFDDCPDVGRYMKLLVV
jgi:2-methylcitrate dehydratase